jgi:hypothetical protein
LSHHISHDAIVPIMTYFIISTHQLTKSNALRIDSEVNNSLIPTLSLNHLYLFRG